MRVFFKKKIWKGLIFKRVFFHIFVVVVGGGFIVLPKPHRPLYHM